MDRMDGNAGRLPKPRDRLPECGRKQMRVIDRNTLAVDPE
jgi:hypothetical protein